MTNAPALPTRFRTKGEVKVWLTALGLTTGLLMVVGLLLLILTNGLAVFWPKTVCELTLREPDGQTSQIAGQIVKRQVKRTAGATAAHEEIQLFVGNRDAYQLAFRFIDVDSIIAQTLPPDILLAERMEYGDSLFYPVSLETESGTVIPAEDPQFERTLAAHIREGNQRRKAILAIEKGKIGRINARIRSLELKIRALEQEPQTVPARLDRLRRQIDASQQDYQVLAEKASTLRAEQKKARLNYRLSSGETRSQPVSDIVRLLRPNRMSTFARFGTFLEHAWDFVTEEPREANTEGGIFPAIFGTFVMTILMAVMVTPFGIVAAIYLREYARQGLLVRTVRICVNNLAGVPSIVFGVFGLGFFVYGVGAFIDGGSPIPLPPVWWMLSALGFIASTVAAIYLAIHASTAPAHLQRSHRATRVIKPATASLAVILGLVTLVFNPYFHGFFHTALPTPTFGTGGLLWASLTLALMTLPVVIVATEEALAAVPRGIREAALACGASKWQTIQHIVLPSALPGVMTGVILAMARGAGEVAPLMITGVVKLAPSLPLDLNPPFIHADRKFMHLGFHIYDLGFQSPDSEGAKPMVFATTLLLILLVVTMNLAAIHIRTHLKRKYQASAF